MPWKVLLSNGPDHRIGISEAIGAAVEVDAEGGILDRTITAGQPEDKAVVGQVTKRGGLLGNGKWIAQRHDDPGRADRDPRRDSG